jgi:PAS domain S-box-containing protein
MNFQELSKEELIDEVQRVNRELQEARDLLQAIQMGEIDAVVVHREKGEQIYVLDDANITYRKMIEEMNEGAATFNSDGLILYCNKAFAGLINFKVSEVISKPITRFVNPKFIDLFKKFFRVIDNEPIKGSIKLVEKSGKSIPVMISLHKLALAGMETYLVTVTDEREKLYIKKLGLHQMALEKLTTKLRYAKEKAEQAVSLLKEKNLDYAILNEEYISINNVLTRTNAELLLAKKKAEKSDQLKSAFIANVSHEIRTPLNSILGYTKMLMDSIKDDEQRKHIDVVIHSGKHLLHLIDDIVDISILESGEMKIVETQVVLNDMMLKIKTQFDAYALNKGKQHLGFRLRLPETGNDKPVVYADEFRVHQILYNLLSNAFKYTNEGNVEFGYDINEQTHELLFFVKDTGMGISDKDQEIIFNRFQQGRGPSRDVISGTGLGLAISKGLTEVLGGKIWLDSTLDSGSAFYFTIPYKKVETFVKIQPVREEILKTGIPQLAGKKILLSEDDLFSREMMVYMLRKTNAELIIATDGRETMDKFIQNKVDLVLLDLRLPEIDGYEVLRRIRSQRPETLVIAQTAYAMMDDIRRFKEVGFDDYLLKPVSDDELFGVLHKYLGRQQGIQP